MKLSRTKKTKPEADKKDKKVVLNNLYDVNLDQTADFARGCSQYKSVVQQVQDRRFQRKKPAKQLSRANTSTNLSGTSLSNRSQNRDRKSAEPANRRTHVTAVSQPAISDPFAEASTSCYEVQPSSSSTSCTTIKDDMDAKPISKVCTVCRNVIPQAQLLSHTKNCLQSKFRRQNLQASEVVECGICKTDLSAYDLEARSAHVNKCIDQVCTLSSEVIEECYVCLKPLSSHLMATHVAQCLDKQKASEAERAVVDRRKTVLDCPLCGKSLKSQAGRKNHLKKCRKELGVSHDVMMDRMREQEQHHLLLLQASHADKPSPRKSKRKERSSSSGDEPSTMAVTNMEDVQLAKALSLSLQEHNEPNDRDPDPISVATASPVKDAFTALMSPKKEPVKKKGRKRDKEETVPELLTITREEVARKLADKMASVIMPMEIDVNAKTPAMRETELAEKYCTILPNSKQEAIDSVSLWSHSSLTREGDKLLYYVRCLMPPLSPCKVKAGSKIKSLASIPGRGPDDSLLVPHVSPKPSAKVKDASLNETLIASTQTAVMLAELADSTLHHTFTDDAATAAAAEASGFLKDVSVLQTEEAPAETLLHHFGSMINSDVASDLCIRGQGGTTIASHKFVFAARCSHVYENICEEREVDLEEYSELSILCVLTYLYCGKLQLSTAPLAEVRALAQRWKLTELTSMLGRHKQQDTDIQGHSSLQDMDMTQDRELNAMLKQVWSDDDSDEKDDADDDQDSKDNDDHGNDDDGNDDALCNDDNDGSDNDDNNSEGSKLPELEQSILNSPARKLSQMSDKEILGILSGSMDYSFNHSISILLQDSDDEGVDCHTDSEDEMDTGDDGNAMEAAEFSEPEQVVHVSDDVVSVTTHAEQSKFKKSLDVTTQSISVTSPSAADNKHSSKEVKGNSDSTAHTTEQSKALSVPVHNESLPPALDNSKSFEDFPISGTDSELESAFIAMETNSPVREDELHANMSSNDAAPEDHCEPKTPDTAMRKLSEVTPSLFDEADDEKEPHACPTPERRQSSEVVLFDSDEDQVLQITESDDEPEMCPNSRFYKGQRSPAISPVFDSQPSQIAGPNALKSSLTGNSARLSPNDKTGSPVIVVTGNSVSPESPVLQLSQKRKRVTSQSITPISKRQRETCDSPVFGSSTVNTSLANRAPPSPENEGAIDLTLSDDDDKPEVTAAPKDESDHNVNENDNSATAQTPQDDAWEDFDDDGFMEAACMVEQHAFNATGKVGSQRSQRSRRTPAKTQALQITNTPTTMRSSSQGYAGYTGEPEYDPPTDIDTDVSMLQEEPLFWTEERNNGNEGQRSQFVTPIARPPVGQGKKNDVVPSPFTPMLNYGDLPTPRLRDECKRFGMKPQGKKNMIRSLTHIYHGTHQYESDTDVDVPTERGSQPQENDNANHSDSSSSDNDADENHPGKLAETFLEDLSQSESGSEKGSPSKSQGRGRGRPKGSQSRKRQPTLDASQLRERLKEFIKLYDQLYEQVLNYEPIEFDKFCAELKENGIIAKPDVIGQVLDEFGLTYTTKTDSGPKWGRRRQKRRSPRK